MEQRGWLWRDVKTFVLMQFSASDDESGIDRAAESPVKGQGSPASAVAGNSEGLGWHGVQGRAFASVLIVSGLNDSNCSSVYKL